MKKSSNNNSKNNQQEKMIENTIKTEGFLFPETIEEVKEFERIYGTTDVILPIELQEPTFLYSITEKNKKAQVVKMNHSENFAMAAREGSSELPKDVQQKILDDIKTFEQKKKKRK